MWWALWRLDPWGEQRADLRNGITASLIANVNRDSRKRTAPFRPDEFMPYLEQQPKEEVDRDLSRRIRAGLMRTGQNK